MRSSILAAAFCAAYLIVHSAAANTRSAHGPVTPEGPSIFRDVATIQHDGDDYFFTRPHLPPLRTSADGRVGVYPKGATLLGNRGLYFSTIVPEMLDRPFSASDRGTVLSPVPFLLSEGEFPDLEYDLQHAAICDPTSWRGDGPLYNPYACNADGDHVDEGDHDCYELAVIASGRNRTSHGLHLIGVPVRIVVAHPKTVDARVVDVHVGKEEIGAELPLEGFLEPMVTQDGRLIVGRTARSTFRWDSDEGARATRSDLAYLVYDETEAPCDVTKWDSVYPITHAHFDQDNSMPRRYGFAKYQLRDPTGAYLDDGVDLMGTYPWVDRAGNNVFFQTINASLYYLAARDRDEPAVLRTRYPSACLDGVDCADPEPTVGAMREFEDTQPATRGISVAGLWTHGKVVLLDGLLNNTDYGLRIENEKQRMVTLYQPETGAPGFNDGRVRVGAGRYNRAVAAFDGSVGNINIIDSIENLLNYNANMMPLTKRDVVWLFSAGRGTAEIAFDDYLDPEALIVSDMTGALSWPDHDDEVLEYHDGFRRLEKWNGQRWINKLDPYGKGFRHGDGVRVQNAATSVAWTLPPWGEVVHGRLEPVALGGIEGKGLWLDGTARIEYTIGQQAERDFERPWFVSLFFDMRFDDDDDRVLLGFRDDTVLALRGRNALVAKDADSDIRTFDLRGLWSDDGYHHLGLVIEPGEGATRLVLYVDGFRLDEVASAPPMFRIEPGKLSVGGRQGELGLRGWVDEFKVLAHEPNAEVICNHARGTLVGFAKGEGREWNDKAKIYPASSHALISGELSSPFDRYACVHDYSIDYGSHYALERSPLVTPIRDALLFPEGPLVFGEPRPNSLENAFCHSCHQDGLLGGLGLDALEFEREKNMEDDDRQPLQPPRLIFGNIPAGVVTVTDLPGQAMWSGEQGALVDQWMYR